VPPEAIAGSALELDFFVLGAQKAGTTTLHAWLATRPELALPRLKETHYLCDEERWALGEDWYARSFAPATDGARRAEVDPEYLTSPLALDRLHRRWPRARLVVLLRSPLERSRSHHEMSRARGLEPLEFEAALDAEAERTASGAPEALRHHAYFARSRYATWLDAIAEHAPGHPLHLVRSDELFGSRGEDTWHALLRFLQLEPGPIPERVGMRNGRWAARSGWLNRHLRQRTGLRRLLGRLVPSREWRLRLGTLVDRWNQRPLRARANAPVLRAEWRERFDAEVAALEARTGWDLANWRSEAPR
jgi:hypothetical protein